MTPAEYRALQSEASFLQQLKKYADLKGWRCYHTRDSRRSEEGFPDLVMVRGQRLIFAELKSAKGRLRPEQQEWLVALQRAQHQIDSLGHEEPGVFVWRPSDWDSIEGVLAR